MHVHLFLDGAIDDWLELPVVLSASWVNRGLEHHGLYLHCAVPDGAVVGFERIVRALANDGWCETFTLVVTGDSWQALGVLSSCVARDGRLRGGAEDVPAGVLRHGGETSSLLRSYPFVVPAVFEAPEERCSMQEVWRRAFHRLGPRVWSYLPRGTRRWPVNGKHYVRHALDLLVAAGLFRQNVIRYRPLLEHAIEVFVLLPAAGVEKVAGALGGVCPVVEIAPGTDGRVLARVTGDEALVYELLRLSRESVRPLGVWLHDYRDEHALSRARLSYETLFDPTTGSWRLSPDEVLGTLRGHA
ncbi:MAG: hypothetical protein EDX89_08450 [Acidobacteria bacterium]|nr:MAG: hypothetical protein EDX89_08450 [Acidobacteriota bacterium]